MDWTNTTHDWSAPVDRAHLAQVRARAHDLAPGGLEHLILEVLAYAADEAEAGGGGTAVVTLHVGGASVSDAGRGTDTRADGEGRLVKKPVMATRDLRFFDAETPPTLPDGHARRGMSVVCALSSELMHVSRRNNGSWMQRYAAGVPITDLHPIPDDGTTGTTVSFTVDLSLGLATAVDPARLSALATSFATQGLTTELPWVQGEPLPPSPKSGRWTPVRIRDASGPPSLGWTPESAWMESCERF